jgi:GT2 family glycosyltransferase
LFSRSHPTGPAARRVVRAEVERIEVGPGFLVASGWVVDGDGSAPGGDILIGFGGTHQVMEGLFSREDLATSVSGEDCAFYVDAPRGSQAGGEMVEIYVDAERVFSRPAAAFSPRSFRPAGSLEAASGVVTGWVFDPGLWWNAKGERPELVLGSHRLPIELDIPRTDLPYSRAKAGFPLGFRIDLAEYLAKHLDANALEEVLGSGSAHIGLFSRGFQLGSIDLATSALRRNTALPLASTDAPAMKEAPARHAEPSGYIDFFGYSGEVGGWIFSGWVRKDAAGRHAEEQIEVDEGLLRGPASFLYYPRDDIADLGVGFAAFIAADHTPPPQFAELAIVSQGGMLLRGSRVIECVDGTVLRDIAKDVIKAAPDGADSIFARAVGRPLFKGLDTIAQLSRPLWLGIDEVLVAPEAGVFLIGWSLDPTGSVRSLRIRSGDDVSEPLGNRWIQTERADIQQSFGVELGLEHAGWGFHAYAPMQSFDPKGAYLEIETQDGEIAFQPLPAPRRVGRAAIMRVLAGAHLTRDRLAIECAEILAPPVIAINRARLAKVRPPLILTQGSVPADPRCSIVVPLYGRLDFLMYQIALASEFDPGLDEYIYVLDDPARKEEFLGLARSVHQRFDIPLRLVLPETNLGFAGASNAGMAAARGKFLCFLNSDVMPRGEDWIGPLTDVLERDPTIGIVGAQLLYEDETVQHAGMGLERLPGMDGLAFPIHPGKGRLPSGQDGVRKVPLVTGACMMMDRELAFSCGGFDMDYVVGDFEDADLCMKVRRAGLDCAVHDGVRLYHLERQSQEGSAASWRHNLTLVNASTFAARWSEAVLAAPLRHQRG